MQKIQYIVCIYSLATSNYCLAITAAPTPKTPTNATTGWLFNNSSSFTWSSVSNATYRIVISKNANFSGFTEANGQSSCNSTCVTFATSSTSANKLNLANFWWDSGIYYWKVRASTPTGGTSPWSQVSTFSSSSKPSIVTIAQSYTNGSAAPSSIIGSPWLTDVYGKDGQGMRSAISIFKTWIDSNTGGYSGWISRGKPAAPATVQNNMRRQLANYNTVDQTALLERIRIRYANTIPTNDQLTLDFFQIRAQCKEFADRIVEQGGGAKSTYTAPTSTDIRPGMYAFTNANTHAAIITSVLWSTSGVATVRLVESNYGSGWSNPLGQIPWMRTIGTARTVNVGPGQPYRVVAN